jgi:recombination protein RecA
VTQENAEGSSRSALDLSERQRAVLVGTLLGDGCLAQHGRHCRLHVKQKQAHKALAELKYDAFREYISMRIHAFDQRLGNGRYPCVQFATRTHPVFTKWYERFYRDGKKIVPNEIARHLSPLAVAVWFMDDGAADFAGATFQTHSFEESEVTILAEALEERFALAVSSRANKGRRILYVRAADIPRLRALVGPHVLPELAYKLVPRRFRTP